MFWFLATVVKQGALLNQTFYNVMSNSVVQMLGFMPNSEAEFGFQKKYT
jgi:hypothetical protein